LIKTTAFEPNAEHLATDLRRIDQTQKARSGDGARLVAKRYW
jgi:hypothetical protein